MMSLKTYNIELVLNNNFKEIHNNKNNMMKDQE